MLDLGTLKIGIDVDEGQAKEGLNSISNEVEKTGKKADGLGTKVKGLIKAFAAAYAVKEIVKIGKAALDAYSNYEQLSGGVEKLFGEESAKKVSKYAEQAYKTAGISANKYMELTTSFSASLLQSLEGDTEAAADYADMAIKDMSDNANVFGSDIATIQSAYQGFAKQNYTMLDNLKLGYGGTKTEMQRLLADASELSGIEYDIANFDDVIEAIHVIQEEQKITGTTAAEASRTIEGSVNMAKASWQNFLTSLGSGDSNQIATAFQNMFSSLGTVAQNIFPVVINIVEGLLQTAITAIGTLPAKLLPKLVELINKLASGVDKEGSSKFAKAAVKALTSAFKALIRNTPALVASLFRLILALVKAQLSALGTAVKTVFNTIKNTVSNAWNAIKNVIKSKLKATIEYGAIGRFIDKIKSAITWWNDLKAKLSKKITAIVEKKGSAGPGKRIGLREVPYDGYTATLHKGEAVLTAAETNQYRNWINKQAQMKNDPNQIMVQASGIDYNKLAQTLIDALSGMNINTEVSVSGKAIAQATAPFMKTEINALERRNNRAVGVV